MLKDTLYFFFAKASQTQHVSPMMMAGDKEFGSMTVCYDANKQCSITMKNASVST